MTISIHQTEVCFQFKASFLTCTVLQLLRYDLEDLDQQLRAAIQRTPHFFTGTPVIIDLEKLKEQSDIQIAKIKQLLINHGMAPIGIRGGTEEQHMLAKNEGLPLLTISKLSAIEINKPKPVETTLTIPQTKIITTPVRSGTQVYAKDTDLIVTAPVSPGAELFADGNIHIYGVLRGRALAGVQGNTQARIFCHHLDAELVAIAGHYLTKEDLQRLAPKKDGVQIYLKDSHVHIEKIS